MSRFVTGVTDLVKEECRTTMLHIDKNLYRLMVYSQSIEKYKLSRISRNFKRGRVDEKNQPRFKKRVPSQDGPSARKVKVKGGSGSQGVNPTCATFGKKHFGKCLAGTGGCFDFGKDDHKGRGCPTIAASGREAKQVPLSDPDSGAPQRNHLYVLQAKGANLGDDAGNIYFSILCGCEFLLIGGVWLQLEL